MLKLERLTPGDGDALYALLSECFGGDLKHVDMWRWFGDELLGRENMRVLRRDGELIGGLGYYRFGQWWGGRVVPLVGVAGVGIRPEDRRSGAARALMTQALSELRAEGLALSALYASTSRLYRSVGYERAGFHCRYSLPLGEIGLVDRTYPVQRIDPLDPQVFHELYRRRAEASAGHLERGPTVWRRVVRPDRGTPRAFLVGPADAPQGYVIYHNGETEQPGRVFDVAVRDLVALDALAARRIWTLIADHGSLGGLVTWNGPPHDPLLFHLPEQGHRVTRHEAWLLRIVDVAAALSQRGYPRERSGELHLELSDELLPDNAGRYVLHVEGGQGRVEPGGRGNVILDVRGLAALYAGLYPVDQLVRLGLLEGARGALELAGRLFAGPLPWLPDHF